jgi:putative spermidine/putrescine transport system permease protein
MTAVIGDTALSSPPLPERTVRGGGRARLRVGRGLVLVIAVIYFVGPLAAAFWFSIDEGNGLTWHAYTHFTQAPGFGAAVTLSLELAAATVLLSLLLMVPTLLLVHLRFPAVRTAVELLSLLPLVVPPIVLVVGVSTVIGWGNAGAPNSLRGQVFNQLLNSTPPLILPLEYVILVLPFVFRSIDAGLRTSNTATLVEAARSLGASWPTTVWRVVLPTLRTSVLNASFLAFALVLGEFTMARLLQYQPFAVWLLQFGNTDGQLSVALSLLSLLLTWLLLIVMTVLAGRGPKKAVV